MGWPPYYPILKTLLLWNILNIASKTNFSSYSYIILCETEIFSQHYNKKNSCNNLLREAICSTEIYNIIKKSKNTNYLQGKQISNHSTKKWMA